jgi:glycosyltransferase involved in cell wall biosynthesis
LQKYIEGIADVIRREKPVQIITLSPNPTMRVNGTRRANATYLKTIAWYRNYPFFNILSLLRKLGKCEWEQVIVVYPFPIVLDLVAFYCALKCIPVSCVYVDDIVLDGALKPVSGLYESIFAHFTRRVFRRISVMSHAYAASSRALKECDGELHEISPVLSVVDSIDLGLHKASFKNKLGFDTTLRVHLFVGGLRERLRYKRLDVVLQAWRKYSEVYPEDKLIVVGSGELSEYYRDMARSLGLTGVSFEGFVEDGRLVELYKAADTFVIASDDNNEAFGIVCVEAMTCGCTLVVTDIPAFRGSVGKESLSGVYFAHPNSVKSFENGIRFFRENLDSTMAVANMQYARRHYSRKTTRRAIRHFAG